MRLPLLLGLIAVLPVRAADPPKRDMPPAELIGKARGFRAIRDYASYYWRDDFTFQLDDEKTGKTWRIISREPTPAYTWRMGPTTTGLKVDWARQPRVKVIGVVGVDRIPVDFHDLKLNEPLIATALIVRVETKPNQWDDWYVNNWFHDWGAKADRIMHAHHADKKAPYDVYGFIKGQSAPFSKASQEILKKSPGGGMFHGLIRTNKDVPFGYEIELLHVIGRDDQGNARILYGDTNVAPLLDGKK